LLHFAVFYMWAVTIAKGFRKTGKTFIFLQGFSGVYSVFECSKTVGDTEY